MAISTQQALSDFQSGKISADQYNQFAASYSQTGTGSYTTAAPAPTSSIVNYDAKTGQRLAPGATTTDALGNTFTQGTTYAPPTTQPIQASAIGTQPMPVVQPKETAPYPTAGLYATPQLEATPQEQKASDMTGKLGTLYNSLVGRSEYQASQEAAQGIPALAKTQQDLTAQLTAIKNEAAAIPLQLQQGAADRGVTLPVLGRQENSRLRTNAIAALGVSTLLAASQGQLATAQSLADKAVAQKYEPIMEQITAMKANLQLILDDPRTSLQDKNRALAQMDIQNQREAQTSQERTSAKEVWNIATTAATNGQNFKPSAQYPNLATTLQAISTAPTQQDALNIAAATGLISSSSSSFSTAPGSKVLGTATTGYFSYDPNTGQTAPIKNPSPTAPTSGSGSTSTASSGNTTFYASQIMGQNPSYVDATGNIKWSGVPAALRSKVYDEVVRLQAAQPDEAPAPSGFIDNAINTVKSGISTFFSWF